MAESVGQIDPKEVAAAHFMRVNKLVLEYMRGGYLAPEERREFTMRMKLLAGYFGQGDGQAAG